MSTFFAVMAVLIFVTALGGVTGVLTVDKIKSLLNKPQSAELPAPKQFTAQDLQVIILHQVQHVKEFSVYRQDFEDSFIYRDDRKVFGVELPLTKTELEVKYRGTVVCGCDLNRAIYADDTRNGRIKIIIPSGKILDIYAIPGTLETAANNSQVFAREVDLEKYDAHLRTSLEKMRNHLTDDGILEETNERIRRELTGFIAGVNPQIRTEIIFIDEQGRLDGSSDLPRLGGGNS